MDLVKGPQIQQLRTKVKQFLDTLVEGEAMWVAGAWTRTNYGPQVTSLVNTTCSLYSSLQMFPPHSDVYWLRLILTNAACSDHVEMMKAMHVWKQEPRQQAFINKLTQLYQARKTNKRRGVLLYLVTGLCGASFAHATFMFFDFKRHLQIYFDPQMGLDDPVSFVRGFAEFQMIPGCVPIPLEKTVPLLYEDSLQERFQQDFEADDRGVCGVLMLVVTMLCIRFQYYNPLHICELMIQAYPQANQRTELCRKLISWYFSFKDAKTIEEISDHIHKPSTIGCSTFSSSSGKLCSRPSCKGQGVFPVYCWQHRHIVKNPRSKNKKCTANQVPCA